MKIKCKAVNSYARHSPSLSQTPESSHRNLSPSSLIAGHHRLPPTILNAGRLNLYHHYPQILPTSSLTHTTTPNHRRHHRLHRRPPPTLRRRSPYHHLSPVHAPLLSLSQRRPEPTPPSPSAILPPPSLHKRQHPPPQSASTLRSLTAHPRRQPHHLTPFRFAEIRWISQYHHPSSVLTGYLSE